MIHYFKTIVNSKFSKLVKSKELLADLVSGDGHLASALSRKIHTLTKETVTQAHIQENIFLLHRFP